MFGDESDREDYAVFWNDVLNLLLAETFDLNNALRASVGKPRLTEIPRVTTLDDEISYEQKIVRAVLPLGGAAYLFLEDEPQIAGYYAELYQNMKDGIGGAQYSDFRV